MSVALLLTNELKSALEADGIDPKNYGPAYNGESVGLDLYNAGEDIVIPPISELILDTSEKVRELDNDLTWLDIAEDERKRCYKVMMPTGIRMVVPRGYGAYVRERGSVTKTPLRYRAGVIDPGYTGPVWVNIINISDVPYVLKAGAKSPFQIVVLQTCTDFTTVNEDEFEAATADAVRRTGQIGSSDKG